MSHPADKSFIYETSELPETRGHLTFKPCNTNASGFVGVSFVLWQWGSVQEGEES